MSQKKTADISGFEFQTEGTLLNRVISVGATGFCHERSVVYRKTWHTHDRLNLAFPRGGSVIRYKTKSGLEIKIEPNEFSVLPANIVHMHWAETTVWNNFALFPSNNLVDEVGGTDVLRALPELSAYSRSNILNDSLEKLLHDAIFRKLPEKDLKPTYVFVLNLIFDEVRMRAKKPHDQPVNDASRGANDVLILLENHLFEDIDANEIADKMGMSRASLYRSFKSITGKSIMGYVRHRRMEEARQLMKTGNLKLGDIALLVGYEDLYTFSTAYKNIFGFAPSKDPSVRKSKD